MSTVSLRATQSQHGLKRVVFGVAVPGPQGEDGPSGSAAASYEYDSGDLVLASHVINHDLGFKPNYSAFDKVSGLPLVGVPIHHTVNQFELQLNTPRSIVVRLS